MISESALTHIRDRLAAAAEIRHGVPGGRLHIDRPLPFLILYRTPPGDDDGAATLVLGSPSSVTASGDAEHHEGLVDIIETVATEQRRAFGAFLLVELWVSESTDSEATMDFRIMASDHDPPDSVLEELESALLTVDLPGAPTPRVMVSYTAEWSPPGLCPIVPSEGSPFCHLGLEVPPIFRQDPTGVVLPFELRAFRRELGRALKMATYRFVHDHTTLRPAHFHELGRQSMTQTVYEVDAAIADIALSLDLLLHVTPVNVSAAQEEYLNTAGDQPPEFLYRARTVDPDATKRRLYGIPIERIEDPTIAHIFLEKRHELDRQLGLVADRNTPRFRLGSRALYGDPEPDLLALARQILDEVEPPKRDPELVTPRQLVARAERELDAYRAEDPTLASRVELRDDVPGVMVSSGNLLVGNASRTPVDRVDALLTHEIGTHVLTHHNGRQQPFRELYGGMAGYDAMQEGLAVLWEHLVGGLDGGRIRLLGARVVAGAAVCDGADFTETHRLLTNTWGLSPSLAFNVAMRLHRGGGFIKDVIYLRGLAQVLEYLASGAPIELLHIGKISKEHLPVVEELLWRQLLEPPRLLPRQRHREDVKARLQRCREGITVLDLIGAT